MPYSKTPVIQTYETKRVNFISNPQQRSSDPNKDFRLVNMATEVITSPIGDNKKYYIKSRAGLSTAYTTQTGAGRGIFYWTVGGVGHAMAVVGNKVYNNGVAVLTLTTSTGYCGFTEFTNSSNVTSLVLLDGTKGYVFSDPSTAVEITSAEFPTPHIPMPVYLDQYLFVAKVGSQDIYNSDVDDPSAWTAGNLISANIYPDTILALSKNNNFLYAVSANSVEYFYDAGNATGSPLSKQPSAVQQFGTAVPATVVQTDREVVFVGETSDGGHTVWIIDGFKEDDIAIPSVKSALLAEDGALSSATAFEVRISGQKYYVLCLSLRTLVYSFDTKMWTEWMSGTSVFKGKHCSDGPNGSAYVLDATNGKIYLMNETIFTDDGVPIVCSVTTAKLDFDTINRKFMYRLSIIGDVPDDTGSQIDVSVQWSDNDYKTWNTARTLKFNADLPAIWQLGQFRRRAFKLSYSSPHLFRIEMIEVDINKGSV